MHPASRISIQAKYDFSLPWTVGPTMESGNSRPHSRTRNRLIPSTPRCHEIPKLEIHTCW